MGSTHKTEQNESLWMAEQVCHLHSLFRTMCKKDAPRTIASKVTCVLCQRDTERSRQVRKTQLSMFPSIFQSLLNLRYINELLLKLEKEENWILPKVTHLFLADSENYGPAVADGSSEERLWLQCPFFHRQSTLAQHGFELCRSVST